MGRFKPLLFETAAGQVCPGERGSLFFPLHLSYSDSANIRTIETVSLVVVSLAVLAVYKRLHAGIEPDINNHVVSP